MTTQKLFGPEVPNKPRTIKFKQIKAVYEKFAITVSEDITNYLSPNARYTSPSQIFETFKFLQAETKEYFVVLHLDGKNKPQAVDICSIGSLNQSIVHPREVFKTALLSSAAAVIFLHNHPSGDPTPSREDREITRRLKEAGELLGIAVIDHILIGESYFSFIEGGLL